MTQYHYDLIADEYNYSYSAHTNWDVAGHTKPLLFYDFTIFSTSKPLS